MLMMGWPAYSASFPSVLPSQSVALTGEGVHCGCMALVLFTCFLNQDAPWWGPQAVEQPGGPGVTGALEASSSADPPPRPKKQRRVGALKLLTRNSSA
jgi:hypothetical protein